MREAEPVKSSKCTQQLENLGVPINFDEAPLFFYSQYLENISGWLTMGLFCSKIERAVLTHVIDAFPSLTTGDALTHDQIISKARSRFPCVSNEEFSEDSEVVQLIQNLLPEAPYENAMSFGQTFVLRVKAAAEGTPEAQAHAFLRTLPHVKLIT